MRSIELEEETNDVGGPVGRMTSAEEMVADEREAVSEIYADKFTVLSPQQWHLSLGEQINLVVEFPAEGYPSAPLIPVLFISDIDSSGSTADPTASKRNDLKRQLPMLTAAAQYAFSKKQCKEAGADPNALLTFGLRKLKKVGPPKVSEYSSQFKVETGKVVGEQPAESDVDEDEGGGADIPVATTHNVVLQKPLSFLDDDGGKRPVTVERAVFATGCFWGAEKGFWRLPGVYSTATGYVSGDGDGAVQVEAVQVLYDTKRIAYADLLTWFWECHNPTQVGGQGNDVGPAYTSSIYTTSAVQQRLAAHSRGEYQKAILDAGNEAQIVTQFNSSQPKLGAAFWRKHGPSPSCVLKVTDEQISWSAFDEDRVFTGVANALMAEDPDTLMSQKAHGTTATAPHSNLRWGCSLKIADRICCFNRRGAEPAGYFVSGTTFLSDLQHIVGNDSTTTAVLLEVEGRSMNSFIAESVAHGWPSFRDNEVVQDNVRVLPDGEVVSVSGTHLGHNIPDSTGNRESTKAITSLRLDENPEAFGNTHNGGGSSNGRGVPRAVDFPL
eukprot:gene15603-2045_t